MADKVLIGIHGLANKPPKAPHQADWEKAIDEGLGAFQKDFRRTCDFELVYWADKLYKQPLHSDPDFTFDNHYDGEPYYRADKSALKPYRDGFMDKVRAWSLDVGGDTLDATKGWFGFSHLADWVLGKKLKDLAYYYDQQQELIDDDGEKRQAATVLRNVLHRVLLKHKGKQICLISHSMGTIISYDVLRWMGQQPESAQVPVSHFITLGSPLGLPHVKHKILKEAHDSKVRTPTLVHNSWVNFADRGDPVALDVHLADDFGPNASKVQVVDDLVQNDYCAGLAEIPPTKEKPNAHKIYGYLRCPEFSEHLASFLR